jgi:polar amino acid transport system permease protein
VLGLITGLGRVSSNLILYTASTLYVEVVRGIPILVQLIYWAFVITPFIVNGLSSLGEFLMAQASSGFLFNLGQSLVAVDIKNIPMTARGIMGLAVAYGAYEAEVFRAGIESIERGQMEAARSLGMSYFQAMRYVILPQAIRRVLPPLGNDFISMLKDSSLLSALAIRELTQLGKLNRARTFRTFETWNMVAFLYLGMTLILSMVVKAMERRLSIE